jgi:general secretion pathway protein C
MLIPLISLMLILSTAQGAARLSWRLFDLVRPIPERLAARHDGSDEIVRPERAAPDKELMDLHLFGQAGRMTVATLPDSRDLPQTSLRLALIGVIFSSSPEKSVAIIKEKESTEEAAIYGVGDQLPGNSMLREIHTDRVILVRAGNHEMLPLDEGSPAPAAGIAKGNRPKAGGPKRRIGTRNQPPIQPRGDGASLNIERDYLNQRLTNLNSLASEIKAEVYQVGGDQQGYRLQAGSSSELLGQLGLQNGDILTEVNGMPLRSNADVMQAYKEMKNAEKLQIQFLRNGIQQTMEYTIGQI